MVKYIALSTVVFWFKHIRFKQDFWFKKEHLVKIKLYFLNKKSYCEAIIIVKKYFSTMSYKVFNTSFEAVGSCIMESRVTPYIFGCNLHSFTLAYKVKLQETLLGVY